VSSPSIWLFASGDSFVGPDGFQQQRGHPKLVDRSARSEQLTGVTFPLERAAAA
jgi:hypothetical protein